MLPRQYLFGVKPSLRNLFFLFDWGRWYEVNMKFKL